MSRILTLVIGVLLVALLLGSTLFSVGQEQYALVYSMGELREVIKEPGLHVKMPQPFQNVVVLDRRLQTLDTADGQHFLTLEKRDLLIDAVVKWKIADPRRYKIAIGDSMERGTDRLSQLARTALTVEIGKRGGQDIVAGERTAIGTAVRDTVAREARELGVDVVDVHIKRVGYSDQANTAVLDRMKAARMRMATQVRDEGLAEGERIRSDAERARTELLADAQRQVETIKGDGDAKAAQLYAASYGKNPEFYRFYRSLEAYRATFKGRNDVLVLDTNSEFFRYFHGPGK
jgi:membrane protease subunit HflC